MASFTDNAGNTPTTGAPHPAELQDAEFDTKIANSKGIKIVDFWAEWCGPCRQLSPTIQSLAEQFSGKAEIYKMNVDSNPNTPSRFRVRGIPTVTIFKDGQPVDQLVGNQPRDVYVEAIRKHLG